MKNSILIFATFITFFACSKDDNSTNPNPTNTNGISVKINGVLWEGSTVSNMVDESTEQVVLQALKSSPLETLGITFDYFNGVGTYPTSNDNFTYSNFLRADKTVFSNQKSSKITINVTSVETTTSGKKVHGTFSGSLQSNAGEIIQLTEGKF